MRTAGDGNDVGVQGGGDLEPAGGGAGAAVALHPAGAHLPEDQEHPPHQRTVGEYTYTRDWGEETKLRAQHFALFGVHFKVLTDSFVLNINMTTQ